MIIAHFRNGVEITYTRAVYGLLCTDKEIAYIIDATTGEIIFENKKP